MAMSDPIAYNVDERIQPYLPDKSRVRYEAEYAKFMKWQEAQDTNSFTEEVLLEYFGEMAKTVAPTTLCTGYSKLKPMLSSKHNVNIGEYAQLLAFLKKAKEGFISNNLPRQFTADEVNKFLQEASDTEYVVVKAVTVFAICVSTRSDTLISIKMEYIKDYGTEIVVRVPNPKTNAIKVCTISGKMVDFVRNYIRLRPKTVQTDRLFIQCRDGKCVGQHVGKQTIARMPQKIAKFLGWPESDIIGGLNFKRMSNAIMSNAKVKPSSAFEVPNLITGRIEAAQAPENNYSKNATEVNLQMDRLTPSDRIKQEDEQHFEAGEYILSETNHYSTQDIDIKTEEESPDDNSDFGDHGNVNHCDTTPINRITPDQRLHPHELTDTFPSETNPNKRLKCAGDVLDASNSFTSCGNCSLRQQTIKAQAEEMARLKQLTDRQNLKIESLETLLLDSLRKKFETS
ncbi:uncharacterized protein LOC119079493 isoform X2 [Bradysia coprophila]|uniref:uncharacterized protein LOC119079493 isoform X2 n=1 Tax=Bradysia coprophila TaxID=38358 RepID=UPI00187DA19F|nr:uncharacterized protein LOC119079493 isoform X2 [Bradysia coprophila]